ncbi:hypothetical protein CIK96_05290 [Prevotella sp. P4-98]|nr:hypothetical protein CIK96_05290 [Prevotella sp. P4-98]
MWSNVQIIGTSTTLRPQNCESISAMLISYYQNNNYHSEIKRIDIRLIMFCQGILNAWQRYCLMFGKGIV